MNSPPKGIQRMKHRIEHETWSLLYGTRVTRILEKEFPGTIMMPNICVTMPPYIRRILHSAKGFAQASWPFVTLSSTGTDVVVPFEAKKNA